MAAAHRMNHLREVFRRHAQTVGIETYGPLRGVVLTQHLDETVEDLLLARAAHGILLLDIRCHGLTHTIVEYLHVPVQHLALVVEILLLHLAPHGVVDRQQLPHLTIRQLQYRTLRQEFTNHERPVAVLLRDRAAVRQRYDGQAAIGRQLQTLAYRPGRYDHHRVSVQLVFGQIMTQPHAPSNTHLHHRELHLEGIGRQDKPPHARIRRQVAYITVLVEIIAYDQFVVHNTRALISRQHRQFQCVEFVIVPHCQLLFTTQIYRLEL